MKISTDVVYYRDKYNDFHRRTCCYIITKIEEKSLIRNLYWRDEDGDLKMAEGDQLWEDEFLNIQNPPIRIATENDMRILVKMIAGSTRWSKMK